MKICIIVTLIFVLLPFHSFIREMDKSLCSNRSNAQTFQSKKIASEGVCVQKCFPLTFALSEEEKKSEIKKCFSFLIEMKTEKILHCKNVAKEVSRNKSLEKYFLSFVGSCSLLQLFRCSVDKVEVILRIDE